MIVEVKIPEGGESVTEGLLAEWSRDDGSILAADEPLLVLETDKITMDVNSPNAGRLEILVPAGETVNVGQVVARIDTEAAEDDQAADAADDGTKDTAEDQIADATADAPSLGAPAGMPQVRQTLADLDGLSPAVQRLIVEHRLDPSAIDGTGKGGRLTKEDVLKHIEASRDRPQPSAGEARPAPGPVPVPAPRRQPVPAENAGATERQSRATMSPLRQRLAERLVQVQQTAAILTTFNEVDMSRVIELRKAYRPQFKDTHDVDLGFMSFFVKACVDALRTYPEVNAFIEGDAVVTNHYYDIGVAVSTDKGLVVPVIRDADQLSMAEIERAIVDLATRARDRRLELSDMTGAIFTISNGGVFGSLLSTPVLNPPGSAILGMHTIQKRPVVIDDEIVIRPMMYLALSYDHRLIDGRGAVTFLRRIVEGVANPERLLLEV